MLPCATPHDGNTSDSEINNFLIAQLATLQPPQDAITIVGDCKLADGATTGHLLDEELHLLTRLPRSYNCHAGEAGRHEGLRARCLVGGHVWMPHTTHEIGPGRLLGES
jgi:hypothetical protein